MSIFFITAAVCFSLDLISKLLVRTSLPYGVPVRILGDFFRFTYIENSGVVFGMFRGKGVLLLPMMIIALVLILVYVIYSRDRVYKHVPAYIDYVSLGMIFGGGVANVFERVTRGVVTDFIDVGLSGANVNLRWYAFNLADSFIVVGLILQVYVVLKEYSG